MQSRAIRDDLTGILKRIIARGEISQQDTYNNSSLLPVVTLPLHYRPTNENTRQARTVTLFKAFEAGCRVEPSGMILRRF